MRKRLIILSVLLFGFVCFSQNALANVTLKVNANTTTPATNKIYYGADSLKPTVFTLPWKEKALYDSASIISPATEPAGIHPIITVNNAIAGDLIVKMDLVSDNGTGVMVVKSYWLKYASVIDPDFGFSREFVEIVKDGEEVSGDTTTVTAADLTTLYLKKGLAKGTTITLFDFITKNFLFDGHMIFTAILVDDVTSLTPQVIGVDVQTVFFSPNWITLIKSNGSGS